MMMKKPIRILILAAALAALATAAGCSISGSQAVKSDALYQVSLLNALMQGDYQGTTSIATLKDKGNTGIGTFDQLDGELIMLDGEVYKAKADGTVEKQTNEETVPFAAVTCYDEEYEATNLKDIQTIEALKASLDTMITQETGDYNSFYVAVIEGEFTLAHVRSVPAQMRPYKPLAEITKDQVEFKYENVKGTIIALRCPAYMEGINLPGWHLHFISKDKTKGGHLLDLRLEKGTAGLDRITEFSLKLPGTEAFSTLKLGSQADQDVTAVESKK